VDLTLREGEILGIAGTDRHRPDRDAARLFRAGSDGRRSVLFIRGKAHIPFPAQRLAQGIGLLSENRKEEGLLLNRSLADNLTITRYGPVSKLGVVNRLHP